MSWRPLLSVSRHASQWQRRVDTISVEGLAETRTFAATSTSRPRESVHTANLDGDKLDLHLERLAQSLCSQDHASIHDLYYQYQHEVGTVIDRVVPYEEHLSAPRRANMLHKATGSTGGWEGDGLVLVVHAKLSPDSSVPMKTAVCSGFVIDASVNNQRQGDTIVTCAHTLEQAG